MTEYTPTPEEVQRRWAGGDEHEAPENYAQFDRMLSNVKAEAKAEGYSEGWVKGAYGVQGMWELVITWGGQVPTSILDQIRPDRAAEIEKGESDV